MYIFFSTPLKKRVDDPDSDEIISKLSLSFFSKINSINYNSDEDIIKMSTPPSISRLPKKVQCDICQSGESPCNCDVGTQSLEKEMSLDPPPKSPSKNITKKIPESRTNVSNVISEEFQNLSIKKPDNPKGSAISYESDDEIQDPDISEEERSDIDLTEDSYNLLVIPKDDDTIEEFKSGRSKVSFDTEI